jgi:uncharacterized protein (DUF433 family)
MEFMFDEWKSLRQNSLERIVKVSNIEVHSHYCCLRTNGQCPLCIRGLRIPVVTILEMLAEGMTEQEILAAYPDLEPEDIKEALKFAAEAVQERQLPLVTVP